MILIFKDLFYKFKGWESRCVKLLDLETDIYYIIQSLTNCTFLPGYYGTIDSASLSWTILTKNTGHIPARIYLARIISAFVGWIISADKQFCPEYSGKVSAKIGLNKWGTLFAQKQTLAKIPPRSAQILPTSFATWALSISCLC